MGRKSGGKLVADLRSSEGGNGEGVPSQGWANFFSTLSSGGSGAEMGVSQQCQTL